LIVHLPLLYHENLEELQVVSEIPQCGWLCLGKVSLTLSTLVSTTGY